MWSNMQMNLSWVLKLWETEIGKLAFGLELSDRTSTDALRLITDIKDSDRHTNFSDGYQNGGYVRALERTSIDARTSTLHTWTSINWDPEGRMYSMTLVIGVTMTKRFYTCTIRVTPSSFLMLSSTVLVEEKRIGSINKPL